MKILFLAYGSPDDPHAWSNVPYLFSKTLREKGHTVIGYDIDPNRTLNSIFDKLVCKPLRLINRHHEYRLVRSSLFHWYNNCRLQKIFNRHKDADLCIILNYDYYNKWTKVPTLLFHDWSFDILLRDREKRKIHWYEKPYSRFQEEAINKAQYVVSLFPDCAKQMALDFPKANIHFLGNNVINTLYSGSVDAEKIIQSKMQSHSILFVGAHKYLEGAKRLIEAVGILHKKDCNIQLDIIGMGSKDLGKMPDYAHCWGYLNKSNPKGNERYYEILFRASLFTNPTPIWAGYSSMVEAMYYYTPVAVSPFEEFQNEFGSNINFGKYYETFEPEAIAMKIEEQLDTNRETFRQMCINAHERVKDYTWSAYIERLEQLVNCHL